MDSDEYVEKISTTTNGGQDKPEDDESSLWTEKVLLFLVIVTDLQSLG